MSLKIRTEDKVEMQDADSPVAGGDRQDTPHDQPSSQNDNVPTPTMLERARAWRRRWDEGEIQRSYDLANSARKEHWRQQDRERRVDEYQAYNEDRRNRYAIMISVTEKRAGRQYRKEPSE